MELPVTTTSSNDSFNFEAFFDLNNMHPAVARTYFDNLNGRGSQWEVGFVEPGEHNPCGRFHIRHSSYPDIVEVVVDTRFDDRHNIVYDVHHPMETDILTHADGASLQVALSTAIRIANRERDKRSTVPKRGALRNAVTRVVNAVTG